MGTKKTIAVVLLAVLAGAGVLAVQSCASNPGTPPGQPTADPTGTPTTPPTTPTATNNLPPPPT